MVGFAKADLIILDDWGLAKFTAEQRRDLLELLDDRHGNRSTLVTSQVPVDHWRDVIGDSPLGDAIVDHLGQNAYRIKLKGESLRKRYSKIDDRHPFGVTMPDPASLRSDTWPFRHGTGGRLHAGIGGGLSRNPQGRSFSWAWGLYAVYEWGYRGGRSGGCHRRNYTNGDSISL